MNDESVAVSSAAETEAPAPIEVEDFTEEQRVTWQKTGELPSKPKSGESATPKPGDATKQEGAGAKKAESGTAKTSKEKPDQERNWRQLEADRDNHKKRADDLEARVRALETKDVKPAASSAAPAEKPVAPVKPKRADFTSDEDYEKAYETDYLPKKQAFDAATAAHEKFMAGVNERQKTLTDKWKGIKDEGEKLYGQDGWKKASDAFGAHAIYSGDPFEVYVRESTPEIGAHFLQYMSLKPKDVERIIKLPPGEQWKELWAIEVAMKEELKLNGNGKEPPKSEPADKPKPKVVSDALPPPKEVGGKAAVPEDEEEAALKKAKDGDPSAYMELANRRELAKRKLSRR